jgi:uncharacterized protein YoxC
MDPNTASAVRDIFIIVAAGTFAALCLTIIFLVFKLYRPILETVTNAAKTSGNLSRITSDVLTISEETTGNIAQVSRNAVAVSENLKTGSEELSDAVQTAGEAAKSVSAAADNVSTLAGTVSRFTTLGVSGGGGSSGVGSMLRLLRGIFGGGRRGDGGVQQGA